MNCDAISFMLLTLLPSFFLFLFLSLSLFFLPYRTHFRLVTSNLSIIHNKSSMKRLSFKYPLSSTEMPTVRDIPDQKKESIRVVRPIRAASATQFPQSADHRRLQIASERSVNATSIERGGGGGRNTTIERNAAACSDCSSCFWCCWLLLVVAGGCWWLMALLLRPHSSRRAAIRQQCRIFPICFEKSS